MTDYLAIKEKAAREYQDILDERKRAAIGPGRKFIAQRLQNALLKKEKADTLYRSWRDYSQARESNAAAPMISTKRRIFENALAAYQEAEKR